MLSMTFTALHLIQTHYKISCYNVMAHGCTCVELWTDSRQEKQPLLSSTETHFVTFWFTIFFLSILWTVFVPERVCNFYWIANLNFRMYCCCSASSKCCLLKNINNNNINNCHGVQMMSFLEHTVVYPIKCIMYILGAERWTALKLP